MRKRQVRCRRPISRPPAVPNRISFSTQAMPVRLRCRSFYIGLLCVPLCLIKFLFTPSLQLLTPFPLRNSKLFRFVVFFFFSIAGSQALLFSRLGCLVPGHAAWNRREESLLGLAPGKKETPPLRPRRPILCRCGRMGKKGSKFLAETSEILQN